jgi:hypothetical protein
VLHENGVDKAYFCDSIGFVEVPQFLQADAMVTMDTTGLVADGHFGTWYAIDTRKIDVQDFYLMEHDQFGDEAANIIVDDTGNDTESQPERIRDKRTSVLEKLNEKLTEIPAKSKTDIPTGRDANGLSLG